MTDIPSTVQIVLQEAGYKTWLVPIESFAIVCFEDDAVMGFVCGFDDPGALLARWRSIESLFLMKHGPGLRQAEEKAWNVYSIFLVASSATEEQAREIRHIDEDLERTRKIAACGLVGQEDITNALLPILPIQYRPRLEDEDLTERLKRRIASIAPNVTDTALDDTIEPSEVVRLLGEAS